MVQIRPFAALRPAKKDAAQIAALPYDVYSREEAREKVKGDPLSFLRIDRPETQFPPETDMYEDAVYQKADRMLQEMEEEGHLIQEEQPCYYLYELTMNGRSQTGLAACSSVDDYFSGVIRKHENTRKEKEMDRIRHVDTCSAQTGPIFLAFRSNDEIRKVIAEEKQQEPVYDFTAEDEVRHRVWVIRDQNVISRITALFEKLPHTYIADGHHRAASAAAVSRMRRESFPDAGEDAEFQSFLSVLFPAEELRIFDYNRVVRTWNGKTPEQVLKEIGEAFKVEKAPEAPYHPKQKGEIGLYIGRNWYCLQEKPEKMVDDPVEGMDVSYLQREVLLPVFGIADPRKDPNIDFVGGIRGLEELEKRCEKDGTAAFAMYPTSMDELFAVADAGLLMPPKSTWFEPKLRSGLLIHKIERVPDAGKNKKSAN